MASTLLQLVNRVQNELGLSAATTIVGNSTQEVVQLLGLTNAVGYELQQDGYQWQQIVKEYRTTTVFYTYTGTTTSGSTSITGMSSIVGLDSKFMVTGTGINQDTYVVTAVGSTVTISQAAASTPTAPVTLTFSQTLYPMPSDFDRLVDNTQWDKTRHWVIIGPETGQQWQWLKSGFISTGPRMRWRQLGGYFQIWPPLGVADYIGFEYVSNQWVLSAAAQVLGPTPDKSSFTVDTDVCIFNDTLMTLGIKSKYMQAKAWADPYGTLFDQQKSTAIASDAGSATLNMAPRMSDVLITQSNIPDSNFGT